jgi:hypothetical protein
MTAVDQHRRTAPWRTTAWAAPAPCGPTALVPNFTEERVKRFARILESNESLIDDLWQLTV